MVVLSDVAVRYSIHVHVHVYTCLCFQANPDTAGQSDSGGLREGEGITVLQIYQYFTGLGVESVR